MSRTFTSFLLVLSTLLPATVFSQTQHGVADWLEAYRGAADFRPVSLFSLQADQSSLDGTVSNAVLLHANEAALDDLLHLAPVTITFPIPLHDGSVLELELAKVEILAPQFSVGTKGLNPQDDFPFHPAVHYRGIVRGAGSSVAAISITSSGISGMVADETGTRELGPLGNSDNTYVFYKTNDLKVKSPLGCFSDDVAIGSNSGTSVIADDRGIGCKTVSIYFECDYKLYTDKGSSVSNVTNYVTSLFNQVATLYANENVGVAISQIYVWTSPDPYVNQTSISNVLNSFRQTLGVNFNGNLAHFLSTRSLGGGIAYVDVICFKQYAFGVSCINTTFQNVPTYSWSVEVLTHELGHNLGSWHTQSCNWNNGAIDNCVSPEGSCAPGPPPVNGGTIMSYCHLTGNGINFNNGFGPQPGAKIRDKVLNASCLTPSGAPPTGLTTTNITGVSATLLWGAIAGATTYSVQYKVASTSAWIAAGNTTATTFNLLNLSNNTNYQWQVKTDCSPFSSTASFTTGSGSGGGSGCAAPVSLLATNITASSAVLSWAQVSGATEYTVQYKTAASGTWLTAGNTNTSAYNLSGLSGATSYNWKVKANCSSYSATSSFLTSNSGGSGNCNAPASLFNNQITSNSASISWSPVAGATSYTLQLKLANSSTYFTLGTVWVTSVTLNGLQPSTAYHWRVKANCSFYSNAKLLTTPANLMDDGSSATGNLPTMSVDAPAQFGIYPNPANDVVFIQSTTPLADKTKVVVTTVTGAVVLEKLVDADNPGLEVYSIPAGIYLVSVVQNGHRQYAGKVVIAR